MVKLYPRQTDALNVTADKNRVDFNRAVDFKGGGQYVMCETLPTPKDSFRSN